MQPAPGPLELSVFTFDSHSYGTRLAEWVVREELPLLGPGFGEPETLAKIESIDFEQAIEEPISNSSMVVCCKSGVLLLHDFMDESHDISQSINSATGSYWHGIMHRREPDYPNAKYWFRQVGDHGIYPQLTVEAARLAEAAALGGQTEYLTEQTQWDPYRFVDLCERYNQAENRYEELCRGIALVEWQLLFDYCYRMAIA